MGLGPMLNVFLLVLVLAFLQKYSARISRKIGDLHCHSYPKQRNMTCCLIDGRIRCLPYFIIAGTQKSGTTVLSAALSEHPQIKFHLRKEAHYFDRNKEFFKGVIEYLQGFHVWEPRSINSNKNNNSIDNSRLNDLYPPLYGESTPFYIASRLACPRIAELLPHVKMIVLLREPVARAYSEYQMKKRRVDIQNDFVGLMQLYAQNVSRCMLRTNGDLMALKLCVPASISSHSHWNRFTLSQSGRYGSGIDETNRVKSQGEYSVRKHSRMRSKTRRSSGASRSLRVAGDQMVSRCYAFTPQHVDETSGNHVHRQLLVDYSNKTSTPSRFNDCINHTVRSTQTSPITTKRQLSLSDTTPDNIGEGRATSTEKLYFQPHACMGKYAREVLLPLREAFEGEAQTFRECAGSKYSKSVEELEKAVQRCVVVKTGITHQFVYRSMFAAQLHFCFKSIPSSQFLILPSERLQTEPDETMRKIYQFLNLLPDTTLGDQTVSGGVLGGTDGASKALLKQASGFLLNSSHVKMSVDKFFPKFETNTGWRASSSYDPMPVELREEMRRFFSPLNDLLFQMLDTEPYPEWTHTKA